MINFKELKEEPEETVADLCSINLQHLETALQNQASLLAYATAAYENARVDETQAEWDLEETEAEVFNAIQEKEPGLAIGRTDKRVEAHERVKEARRDLADKRRMVANLKALVNGLHHRRDMLVQLSARQRQEMQLV
jgi:hypothetical protein